MNDEISGPKRVLLIGIVIIIFVALILAAYFWVRSQTGDGGQTIPPESTPSAGGDETPVDEDGTGLTIRLSDGGAEPQSYEPLPVTTGEPLNLEEIENILARLPLLEPLAGDQVDFKLPEEVLPPPRTGETIEEPFPLPPESFAPDVE